MEPLAFLLHHKIVAIVRGLPAPDILRVAAALIKGGVYVMEVTLNTPDAVPMINNLSKEFGGTMLIGAGTVLTAEEAKTSIEAGAKFIVSPNTDQQTIATTKKLGAISIPGAFTASEIINAHQYGGDIIKVFPAMSPSYIRNLKGPLKHIRLMPTGGVNIDNVNEFFSAGAVAFGIGSSLVSGTQVSDDKLASMTTRAAQFVNAVK